MPLDTVLHQSHDTTPTVTEFIVNTIQEIKFAHNSAETILKERKEIMKEKSEKNASDPNFKVGDVVYIYEPVVVPGNTAKLTRRFAGPYFIIEKPSPIHAKLRRVSDGKPIKNKVHINRLKPGLLRSTEPIDTLPPVNADATEPVVLDIEEIDTHNLTTEDSDHVTDVNLDAQTATQRKHDTANKHKRVAKASKTASDSTSIIQDTQSHTTPQSSQSSNQMYTVEKILRKKYTDNAWLYRIKWQSFPSSHNSWVRFDDLSPHLQQLVTSTHSKIITDKYSKKRI
jgi:hypothetical protein